MEPVMMDQAELKAMKSDMKKVADINDGLKRDLAVVSRERDEARILANKSKVEVERLRKAMPADKVSDENKGLRTAVSESHKRIGVLEKELAAAKAESEARRKEISQGQQRLSNVQNTFDMMQVARDKACEDRDKALASVEQGAAAYHKLQGEFEEFKKAAAEKEQNEKRPGKAAPQEAKK